MSRLAHVNEFEFMKLPGRLMKVRLWSKNLCGIVLSLISNSDGYGNALVDLLKLVQNRECYVRGGTIIF